MAAASTANVVVLEAAPVLAQAELLTPAPIQENGEIFTAGAMAGETGGLVQITPPPDMVLDESPAFTGETASPSAAIEAAPTPTQEPEPSPTPKQTAKPSPTPAYQVDELDEYLDGYVNAKTINLRKGPGTEYDVLGEYARYDELLVTGTCEEWYRVKLDGLRGYMLKEYVTVGSAPTPTPKATEKPKATATPKPTATPEPEATRTPSISSESEELYLAAQVVYKEGDKGSYVAVANVIYNRVCSSKFPNSIYDVVYQKSQFSTSSLKTPSSAALAAVQQIFVDKNLLLPAEVLYFQAASRGTTRDGYTYYGTFGGNVFFYK
ncbi:hypothetical protein SDC9_140986 [bioreactor metagenome]|uniref:SH3b domain-containing protein n=1 Tax=bioreactor metagenome TaxID=1076179 RepID=A0A645DWE0_9ZZZZ